MHRPPKETLMFAGLFGWEAGKNHAFNGVSITSLNVNLLTRAQKALSGLRRRGFRGYCALKGAFFRLNIRWHDWRLQDEPLCELLAQTTIILQTHRVGVGSLHRHILKPRLVFGRGTQA